MKERLTTIILILILIAGLSLLLYPELSNYWNQFHQSRAVASYNELVENLDNSEYEKFLEEAKAYNESLLDKKTLFDPLNDEESERYYNTLDVTGTGIMGYIDIPSINVTLPIYHGTDTEVLQIAVGHLEWSSLPVGGENTHCVLSGHRGLPSAKLFTSIDRLVEGDQFYLSILGDILAYEVDEIRIVLPEEMDSLQIIEGQDLCTLVTCTPYGVNTQRLLVRGHRVEISELINVSAEATKINPLLVALFIALLIVIILIVVLFIVTRDKNKKRYRFRVGGKHESSK